MVKEKLTDSEYVEIVKTIKGIIEKPDFRPKFFDDREIGYKQTWSNCGFCNDSIKANFVLKEEQGKHKCPFDMGKEVMPKGHIFIGYTSGCFYRCYLFKNIGFVNIDTMKTMVNDSLIQIEKDD